MALGNIFRFALKPIPTVNNAKIEQIKQVLNAKFTKASEEIKFAIISALCGIEYYQYMQLGRTSELTTKSFLVLTQLSFQIERVDTRMMCMKELYLYLRSLLAGFATEWMIEKYEVMLDRVNEYFDGSEQAIALFRFIQTNGLEIRTDSINDRRE